jgi:hypothetical protein
MEEINKEDLKLQLAKDIKSINYDIEYHEAKLSEARHKMQIAEYALRQLTSNANESR